MQTYGEQAGIPPDKQKFHCLRPSIATHLLDASADLAFVKDWLEHANIQNTTISARLTTATLDAQARTIFASHRVVECLLVSEERGGTLSWHASLCPTLATLHPVADKASRTDAEHQQDIGTWLRHAEALGVLRVRVATDRGAAGALRDSRSSRATPKPQCTCWRRSLVVLSGVFLAWVSPPISR
jgi:hypothetical protein